MKQDQRAINMIVCALDVFYDRDKKGLATDVAKVVVPIVVELGERAGRDKDEVFPAACFVAGFAAAFEHAKSAMGDIEKQGYSLNLVKREDEQET